MKKFNIIIAATFIVLFSLPINSSAQEEEKKKPKPVYETFNSSLLGDQNTMIGPREKGLELVIKHRFGDIQKGNVWDLFGLYAPSNISLGLDYGINEKLSVGFVKEKNNLLHEFHAKYTFLSQTRKNEIPVSLTYFGNVSIDARDAEVFGENYGFANRLSYFHQIIVSRKFSDRISAQLAPSYSHFNAVDSTSQNDHWGISAGARVKLFGEFALIANYDQPMPVTMVRYYQKESFPKPNIGFGFEIATGTHCFQMFVANYDKISAQKSLAYNSNDFMKGEFLIGMNVLVRF